MQTNFTAAQLGESRHQGGREDPARLRPLRLLHRDLPDLCAAWRRARQPARPHLPHQGHAGERAPGDRGGRQARRPLPLLPVLHDDLPVGRQLHASRRSRPRIISSGPIAGRGWTAPSAACSARPAPARTVPGGAQRRAPGKAVRSIACRAPGGEARAGPVACCRPLRLSTGRKFSRPPARTPPRVALLTGCAQQVLRPQINEATIRLLDPPRLRGRRVRRAPAAAARLTHHLGQERARLCPRQHPRLVTRNRGGEGSTRSSSTPRAAAPRSRITASCSATIPNSPGRRKRSPALARDVCGIHERDRPPSRRSARRAGASPITAPARCSMASRFEASRSSC